MDNTINSIIIEKVTIKSVAIYKAIGMLPQQQFEDKFNKKHYANKTRIHRNRT